MYGSKAYECDLSLTFNVVCVYNLIQTAA